MKLAHYRRKAAAQRFARDLAKAFPRRQFQVEQHPHDFGYAIGVYARGQRVAFAGKRKAKPLCTFTVRMWDDGTPLGGETCRRFRARNAEQAELDASLEYPEFDHFDASQE